MKGWLKGLVIAGALSALLAASTRAQTVAPANANARQTPAPSATLPPDPELALPDTATAKRLDRSIGDEPLGGADCRTACDKAYYQCLADDDSGRCPVSWAQCLTACPAHSSNF